MRFDDINDQYEDDAIPLKRRPKKQVTANNNVPGNARAAAARSAPVQRPARQMPAGNPVQRTPYQTPSGQTRSQSAQRPVSAQAMQQNRNARPVTGADRRVSVSPQVTRAGNVHPHASRDRKKTYTTGKFTIPEELRGGAGRRRPASSASAARTGSAAQRTNSVQRRSAQTERSVQSDDIPVAIPVGRKYNGGLNPAKKKFGGFKKGFLIYLGVLLIVSIVFLIYVHGLLVDFESSQVENVVASKLEDIKKAASRGKIENEISLETIKSKFSPSEQELEDYEKAFSLGELSYKKSRNGLNSDTESYSIFLNGFHMGNMELKNVKEETVLAIFPVTEWEIVSCSAETFSFDFPASVTISSGGSVIEGKPSETEGLYSYEVSSLFSEDTVITDSAGNTVSFNGKDPVTFVNYTAKVLSCYSVYYGDKLIDPSKSQSEPIETYKYVKEYCDAVPDLAVYHLCLIDNGGKITVKDKSGADVSFKQNESLIEAKEMPKSDTMPEGLSGEPNPLEIAETLSLFTSQDLYGPYNGFDQIAKYFIEGSYIYEKNWEFAKGIDITFASNHNLDDPPFNSEEVSEYVKFSNECFSCRIKFNKPMHLTRNGVVVDHTVDVVDSVYYFVYADVSDDGIDNPHWALVDNSDVAKQLN